MHFTVLSTLASFSAWPNVGQDLPCDFVRMALSIENVGIVAARMPLVARRQVLTHHMQTPAALRGVIKLQPFAIEIEPGGAGANARPRTNRGARVVFIHGFSQGHLSWIKQMRSE
jgi:hypothetical protein